MDAPTAYVIVAGLGTLVSLATLLFQFAVHDQVVKTKLAVDGFAHEKEQLGERAANAEGHLAGIASEQARQLPPVVS